MLRPYQQRAITELYAYLRAEDGNPCIVMPTGSGKSHVIAQLCKEALQNWPQTRILMLTHQKELIEQNAEKLRIHWPNAPLGIYSASVGSRDTDAITFAGIQTVYKRAAELGHQDLILIDEAHTMNHNSEGMYRKLMFHLWDINPAMRVIGFTATPFRLGHGMITDKPAIFDSLIEPVSIEQLVYNGYLCPLKSKATDAKISTDGVGTRGGEFITSELQKAVDIHTTSDAVVDEVVKRAGDRRSWLFFCTGVDHAAHVASILREHGVSSACLTGSTPKKERERILDDFRKGKIKAITNMGVLTTGFDYPGIDLIVFMRPTMSPGLYMQMAGRGMRALEGKTDCLILDFAGVIERHGPITAVRPPKKKGEGDGVPPSKICPECDEIVAAQIRTCPACGYEFPFVAQEKAWQLRNDDIMGKEPTEMSVTSWEWREQTSRSGINMLVATYYGGLSDTPIREYILIFHEGYAGLRAMQTLQDMAQRCSISLHEHESTDDLIDAFNGCDPPGVITWQQDGKFRKVVDRIWVPVKERAISEENDYFL